MGSQKHAPNTLLNTMPQKTEKTIENRGSKCRSKRGSWRNFGETANVFKRWVRGTLVFIMPVFATALFGANAHAFEFCDAQNPSGESAWDILDGTGAGPSQADVDFTLDGGDVWTNVEALNSVTIRGLHQYTGDLAAALVSPSGTVTTLFRLGDGTYGEGASGCAGADFDLTFSDSGVGNIMSVDHELDYCQLVNGNAGPVYAQPYLANWPARFYTVSGGVATPDNPDMTGGNIPIYNNGPGDSANGASGQDSQPGASGNALSNVIGDDPLSGPWKIRTIDAFAQDIGTVTEACVDIEYGSVTYDIWVSDDATCSDTQDSATFDIGETVYVCYVASNEATEDFTFDSETNNHSQSLTELGGDYSAKYGGTSTVRTAIRSFVAGDSTVPVGTTALTGSITVEGDDTFFSIGEFLTTPETVSVTVNPAAGQDFSDAPVIYGDATHVVVSGIQLGTNIDVDAGSLAGPAADGDGSDDDGILYFQPLTEGDTTYVFTTQSLALGSGSGTLHAWIDFDGDGTFEASEYGSSTVTTGILDNHIAWTGQNTTFPGTTFARFRLTTDASINASTPTGLASDGEVEDYAITIESAVTSAPSGSQSCTAFTDSWANAGGGSWTSTASNGVGVTVTLAASAGADWTSTGDGALNNIATFSEPTVQTNTSLSTVYFWDTTAETGLELASDDAAQGTVTIVYDQAVTNPVIHLDRVGGSGGFNPNSSEWTLTTAGASLTRLAGPAHFVVTSDNRIYRGLTGATTGAESSLNTATGTAAGSIMVPGVHSQLDFTLTGVGVEGSGADGIELVTCGIPAPAAPTLDYSDAPVSYLDATHVVVSGIQLGANIDADAGSLASSAADGDGADDDGLAVPSLTAGAAYTLQASVTGSGTLYGWLDFDGDGTFDADETITGSNGFASTGGTIDIPIHIPEASAGTHFIRIRYSSDSAASSPTGAATDGEVEDYQVSIAAKITNPPNPGTTPAFAQSCDAYDYTGSDQSVTVPNGAVNLGLKLWGAGGGHEIVGGGYSGAGGYTEAQFGSSVITAGDTLTLVVGAGGNVSTRPSEFTPASVYGFGSVSGHEQGGGLTGLFSGGGAVSETDQSRALAIAGGGGGMEHSGDPGIGTNGGNGNSASSGGQPTMRGSTDVTAFFGTLTPTAHKSGGGGGYYGGGRLVADANYSPTFGNLQPETAAAAGGSGYVSPTATAGQILSSPDGTVTAPNNSDSDYVAGIGTGSTSNAQTAGGNGRAVLCWDIEADLATVKTLASGDSTPNEGDTVTFLITVTNNGGGDATGVALTDNLPAGLTATAGNGAVTTGSYDDGTGIWTLGDLANGASATLTLEGIVDAGQGGNTITNITTVAMGDQTDPISTGDDLTEEVTVDNDADLVTVKTLASSDGSPAEGDTVTFLITVTNNGAAQATNVSLDDALPAGLTATAGNAAVSAGTYSDPTWTIGTLASGASATLTLEGTVDAGQGGNSITNITTVATGDQPDPTTDGDDLTEAVVVDDEADLVTLKTLASGDSTPAEGDTVTFLITVTNDGGAAATNVTLDDSLPAGLTATANNGTFTQGSYDGTTWTVGSLANGASATLTLEGTVDVGQGGNVITNITTAASGDQPDPSMTGDDLTEEVTVDDGADIVTVKTLPSGDATPAEGDTVTYLITVTNNGAAQATNVSLDDTLPAGLTATAGNGVATQGTYDGTTWTIGTLADGASVTLTLEGTVDVGEGGNTITNITTPAAGDQSDPTTDGDDLTEEVTVDYMPSLTNVKATPTLKTDADTSGDITVGDTLEYVVTVSNTGDVTLTNVVVSDVNLTPSSFTCLTLAPGADCVLTGDHVVTLAEADAGEVVNTASVVTSEIPGPTDSNEVTTTVEADPALTMVKTALDTIFAAVGDEIDYTYLVTNTGNVTIDGINVSDDKITTISCPATSLAPTESTTCTATYTVTQEDLDAGSVTNIASVDGVPTGGTLTPPEATETVDGDPMPALTMVKTALDTTYAAVGDEIDYTYFVENTGNVTISGLTVSDDKIASVSCPVTELAPTESTTCVGTYTVTQVDLDTGSVTNIASVDGTPTGGTLTPPEATETVDGDPLPEMSIVKTALDTTFAAVGDTIDYEYDVTNTGNVTITGLSVTDDKIASVSCPVTELAPTETTICTATYTVTQADLDAGSVTNIASVDGTPTGGTLTPPEATETVGGDPLPEMTIVKTALDTTYAAVGDTINYTYLVTNIGNVTISGLAVADDKIATVTCPATTLAPTASTTCTASYMVTQADLDAGSVTNIASVDGTPTGGSLTPPEATETVDGDPMPELTMFKNALDITFNAVGDTIDYTYFVENTGNVTISDLAVSDDKIASVSCPVAVLAPTESTTCTATYTITQADLDAGSVTNNADADGTPTGGTLTPATGTETVGGDPMPELFMVKMALDTDFAAVGDTIDYTYEVTNSGNVTITDLVVSDDKIASVTCPVAILAPMESTTCTATYTVTQADLDAGSVVNNASVDGSPAGGTLTPATATETVGGDPMPELSMVKTALDTTFAVVGDMIDYEYEVTNTGNITISDLAVSDDKIASVTCPVAILAPTESTTCTATYTVTQADLDAGGVTNNALADGTPSDGVLTPAPATETVDGDPLPELTIVKTALDTTYASVGDTIEYTYLVTNTGNVTISGLSVSDDKIASVSCPEVLLAPTEAMTCTATYTVTQADLDAGSVTNIASVDGSPTGGTLTPPEATETVDGDPMPAMTMVKTALDTSYAAVGDTIDYTYFVENTGNVTISDLAVADDKIATVNCPVTELAPTESTTCTATYTVTQADLDAGSVTNLASVDGTPTGGTLTPPEATETVDGDPLPEMSIVKTALDTTYAAVGDAIDYEYIVTNTGNVTINGLTVSDDRIASVSCPVNDLAPTESTTCTATYIVTQADLDAGSVTNIASVDGTPTGGTLTPPEATETVDGDPMPGMSIVKTALDTAYAAVGDEIDYTYLVENTGNVTISDLAVSDDRIATVTCPVTTLAPTETTTCTATYTVTQVDLDAGSVTNIASVDGTPTGGTLTPPEATETVDVDAMPEMSIVKTALDTTFAAVGDTLDYEYEITNTGNVTISGLTVSDDRIASVSCPVTELAPTESTICTATYIVTQADLDAGSVTNIASVDGTPTGGTLTPPEATETVDGDQTPSLSVDKTTVDTSYAAVGDLLDYEYLVTNTGNVTITDPISVDDDKIPAPAIVSCPALPIGGLIPGESLTCTATYSVTQADLDAGFVTNVASATDGTSVSPPDSVTVDADPMPSMTVDKVGVETSYAAVGDVLTYEYNVVNTGNVLIADLVVTDDLIDMVTCLVTGVGNGDANLDPGETVVCTASYTVTQEDIDNGAVTNNASATGTPSGGTLVDPTDAETIDAAQSPELTMTKTALDTTFAAVGDTINYEYTVENTGNVYVANLSISDDKIDTVTCDVAAIGNEDANLDPGETVVCLATYTITQADLDEGSVTNIAMATGDPSGGDLTDATATETVDGDQTPAMEVVKTATDVNFELPGDITTYEYVVTNTGNTTITDAITVDDNRVPSVTCPALPTGGLVPGATITCTGEYVVTQADLDVGSVTNIASATDGNVTTPTTSETIPADQDPALTIAKAALTAEFTAAGQVVDYEYTVTNSGNLTITTDIEVVDDKIGTFTCHTGNLVPAEVHTCTASYTVTQADVDAGFVTNQAYAESGSLVSAPVDVTVDAVQSEGLTFDKRATTATFTMAGDVLTYEFDVANTGNVTLSAINLSDDLTTVSCPATSLAPSESMVCTASYTVTQADVDAGEVVNNASINATPPGGSPINIDDTATVDTSAMSGLEFTKTALDTSYAGVGDFLDYQLVVTNTGDITLSNINVSDDLTSVSCPLTTLAPAQSMTCSASYVVTQADIDGGSVTNNASVSSELPGGEAGPGGSDSAVIDGAPMPQLNLNKQPVDTSYAAVGDVLSYTYFVENTGNVTISDIVVTDNLIPSLSCPATVLAPSESMTCMGDYTVTQADIDAGSVTNDAQADGTPTQGTLTPPTDSETVDADQTPLMSMVKTTTTSDFDMVGDVVSYEYLVTNEGNTTITAPITVSDDKIAMVNCPALPIGGLLPTESITCTGSYVVSQADIDAGSVTNIASATDGTTTSPEDSEIVDAVQSPSMAMTKTASPQTYAMAGETVSYTYIVTNTGNTTLIDAMVISDDRIASVTCPALPIDGLVPGAMLTCSADYTVTQADIDSGSVTNTASASNGGVTSPDVDETVTADQTPELAIEKVALDATFASVGDILDYAYIVTNTGNVTITDPVSVSDDRIASVNCPALPVGGLAPTETLTCTASYTVTQADIDEGFVTNIASATDGNVTSPIDTVLVGGEQTPALNIVKSALTSDFALPGDILSYEYEVTNTGNVTITGGITVSDDRIASVICPSLPVTGLEPGDSITCMADYVVTQADIDAGSVTNVASATDGTTTSPTDDATVGAAQTPALTLVKNSTTPTFNMPGDVVSYTYEVINSGNVTITDPITVSDDRIANVSCPSLPVGGLAPMASMMCSADYTVTQADIDAGEVVNVASATDGTTTSPEDTRTVVATQNPELSVVKTAVDINFTLPGDVTTFEYVVTNEGNTTIVDPITVDDNRVASVTCPSLPVGGLLPGDSLTCTGLYTATQDDLDQGSVTNVATGTDGTTTSPPVDETIPADADPALAIDKSSTDAGFAAVGDVLTYDYIVTNTGNITLTGDIEVVDNKIGTFVCFSGNLVPGASESCSATYTVTQEDIDTGSVTNDAYADHTRATSGPDTVTLPADQLPGLTIAKAALSTDYASVGDTLSYEFVVTNSGNTTITFPITVSDSRIPDVMCPALPADGLLPGDSITCTGTDTVTQADIDAGSVDNTASATDGVTTSPEDVATVPAQQTPALSIVKTALNNDFAMVGDTLNYNYVVTNSGNVTVTDPITVSDDRVDPVTCPALPAEGLVPGASITCTASDTVTQDDLDAGSVTNTASATDGTITSPEDTVIVDGTQTPALDIVKTANETVYDLVGDIITYDYVVTNIGNITITDPITVSDDRIASVSCPALPAEGLIPTESITCTASYSVTQADIDEGSITNIASATDGTTSSDEVSEIVNGAQTPALSVVKTANETVYENVGDVLSYDYVVTNSGNVTITNAITISDDRIAVVDCPALPVGGLVPGASITCTATDTVTQADIDNGSVVNNASATDGTVTSPIVDETVNGNQTSDFTIDKVALTTEFSMVGDVLTYNYIITNTGNVTLTEQATVTDDRIASVVCPAMPIGGLVPGATITCSGDYTVTQEDLDAGSVINIASATIGDETSGEDTANVGATQMPALSIDKESTTADFTNAGDIVSYTYIVTNTGNVTIIDPITVSDDRIADVTCPALPVDGLTPSATITCTADYTVTQADVDNGFVTNIASATDGNVISPIDEVTVDGTQTPALTVEKSAVTASFSMPGDIVSYEYLVTNNGNVTIIEPITVADDRIADVTCPALPVDGLAPTESITCVADYEVTQEDVDAGSVTNIASASSGDLTSPNDDATVDATVTPMLTITKSVTDNVQAFGPLYDVTYEVAVENTGNVTLTDFQVQDDLTAALTPATIVGTPEVTVTDITGATPNPDYDGSSNIDTLSGTPVLAVGDSGVVTIKVRVDISSGSPAESNTAFGGSPDLITDVPSDDPTLTPGNPNDVNPTPVEIIDTDGDGSDDSLESGTEDRDGDGVPDNVDYDPTGYFYCEENGQILTGGGISVEGPSGVNSALGTTNSITIVEDGSDGYFQFYVSEAGRYTITPTYPTSGVPSTDRRVQNVALDVTSLLPMNPGILGSSEVGDTGQLADFTKEVNSPFYFEFDIEAGDPAIFMNNIPLQHCGSSELALVKTVVGDPVVQTDGRQLVTYQFDISNIGETQVDNIQIVDDLGDVYGDANVIINQNEITAEPINFAGNENAGYDGVVDINVLDGLGSLETGEAVTVQLQALVTPETASTFINKATVNGSNPRTGDPVTGDDTASVDLVPAAKVGDLVVTKVARPRTVQIGDPVLYTIEVTNSGLGNVTDIDIVDNIPAGFAYIPNSASVSDASVTDKVEPNVTGSSSLSWSFGNMNAAPLDYIAPGETIAVNLRLLAGPNVEFGAHENQAYASNPDTGERSGIATATVDYIPEPTFDCTPVLGRVYDDVNHNGYPDDGEPGLPAVRLVTVNGDIITTDHNGRYHIPCAAIADSEHGSNFLLKTDVRTLPLGFTPTTENPRVVRATRGKFVKLNFGAAYRPKLRVDLFPGDFDRGLMMPEAARRIQSVFAQAQTAERALVVFHAADSQDVNDAQDHLTVALKVIEELAPKSMKDVALEASWSGVDMAKSPQGLRYTAEGTYVPQNAALTPEDKVVFVSDKRGGINPDFDVKPSARGSKGSQPLASDGRKRGIALAGRQSHKTEQSARPGRLQRWVGWANTKSSYSEGPEIETTVDALEPVKRLNAQANVVATDEGRFVMAESYHNYSAFTTELEVRLFDADRTVRGKPLAILPVRDGKASMAVNNRWPQDMVYVLRAYGTDGDFDETAPKTLRVGDPEFDLSAEDWDQQAYTAFGQNTLVKSNVTIRGGAVRVFGRNIDAAEVGVMGQTIRVDESGRFVAEQLLPVGQQQVELWIPGTEDSKRVIRMVDVKSRDTFYVAQAEATIGSRPSDSDTFTEGRLAFYVRSRINDRWAFTATADTGEAAIEDLLKGLDDKDVSQLLRRLDPDKYYPVYGDDSTIEQDAPTSGRVYARIEHDDDYLLWGNYQTNFSDTEYGRIQRTLYGAKLHWDENDATKYGDARTAVTGFIADGGNRQGRDELRGTGGSVYYLRHGDISIGSEILRIETRDEISGLVTESRRLTYGTDYDMDFIQGRIILNRPLASSSNDGRLFRDGNQSGNEEVLVADYEYSPIAGAGSDSMIYGARASRWFGDMVKFGATYNHGDDGGVESDLIEADLTVQFEAGTYIKGEIAQTKGQGVETYRSVDGGFTYNPMERGGLPSNSKAMAYAVEAATDLSDYFNADGRLHAYWRKREAGFAGYSQGTNQDVEQYGGGIKLSLFDDLSINARADILDDQNIGTNSFAEASAEYALNDNVKLSAGVSYNDDGRGNDGASVGARAEYAFNDDSKVYVFGQAGVTGNNARTTDRAGIGGELRVGKHLLTGAEVSGGEDGLGARVSARYQEEDGDEYYMAYDLPLHSQVASNYGTFNFGARRRFTDAISVYGEERMQFNERGLNGVTHAYGVDYKPGKWNLGLSGELGKVDDLDRKAVSASVGFSDERMQAGVTSEFRQDESLLTGDTRRTWLIRATALYQLSEELRLQGKLNKAVSEQAISVAPEDFNEAQFTEGSFAAAYRPIWDDRLNVLAKAVYLYDLSPTSQRFNGEMVDYRQKSSIYSVDASYDIHPRWTLGAKYGHRGGEVTDSRESDDFYKSSADLAVLRLDYHMTHKWDATFEGRYLSIGDGVIDRTGGLAMLYRHINDNAKIGVGLTYGGIDQEYLLAQDEENIGWLINVVGKF